MKWLIVLAATLMVLAGCSSTTHSYRVADDLVELDDSQIVERLFAGKASDAVVREALIKKHPEWSSSVLSDITEGRVTIGMDMFQAAAALGKPRDFKIFREAGGSRMLWRYGAPGNSKHVWLANGFVARISQ